MAKKAYIGVDGVARKIKKGYIGILTGGAEAGESLITSANISSYFNIENGEVQFTEANNVFMSTTPKAYMKFITLFPFNVELNFTAHSFNAARESFTVTINGNQIWSRTCEDGYPSSSSWTGTLNAGDSIEFILSDKGNIYTGDGMKATFSIKTIVSETIPAKSVAKQIKKAYIGIGGVARPCWSGGGKLTYYGWITELNSPRSEGAGNSNGKYALFAGGFGSNVFAYDEVVAYDSNLTKRVATTLTQAKGSLASAVIGGRVLFAGGAISSATGLAGNSNYVDGYDASLTKTAVTMQTNGNRGKLGGASNGRYAIFAGGAHSWNNGLNLVDAFDESMTLTVPSQLATAGCYINGVRIGGYALFAGGYGRVAVETYNQSLTRGVAPDISATAYISTYMGATTVGGYALVGGGQNNNVVDAYDGSLTRISASPLQNQSNPFIAATTLGDFAIFAGGWHSSSSSPTVCAEVYDEHLTKTTSEFPTEKRAVLAATVGDFAVFAGGLNSSSYPTTSAVAYTIA